MLRIETRNKLITSIQNLEGFRLAALFLVIAACILSMFFDWSRFLLLFSACVFLSMLFIRSQMSNERMKKKADAEEPFSETEKAFVLNLFWIALGIRVLVTLIFHLYSVNIGKEGFYFFDDQSYDRSAKELMNLIYSGNRFTFIDIMDVTEGFHFAYNLFTFAIYSIAGINCLYAKLFNALFGSLIVVFVYLIARKAFGVPVARTAALITTIDGLSIYWGAFMLKDIFLAFLCAAVLYFWSEPVNAGKHPWFFRILTAVFVFFTFFTRIYTGISIIIAGCIGYLIRRIPKDPGPRSVFLIVTLIIVLLVTSGFGYLTYRFKFFDAKIVVRQGNTGSMETISPKEAIVSFIGKDGVEATARLLYTPFVWKYQFELEGKELYYSSYPFLLLWYLLIPFLLIGFVYALVLKPGKSMHIVSFTVVGVLTLLFLVFAPDRQRTFLLPFFYMFAALGLHVSDRKSIVFAFYTPLLICFMIYEQKFMDFLKPVVLSTGAILAGYFGIAWYREHSKDIKIPFKFKSGG